MPVFVLWMLVLSVGILELGTVTNALWRWLDEFHERKKDEGATKKYYRHRAIGQHTAATPHNIYALIKQFDAFKRLYERHERDRAGREKIVIFIGIITAVAALLSAAIFQGQLNVMHADQRPWLKVKDAQIIDDLTIKNGSLFFGMLKYNLENTGRFAAYAVVQSGIIIGIIKETWQERQRQICNKATIPDTWVVLPNSIFRYRENPENIANDISKLGNDFSAMIVGCIRYRWVGETVDHHTGFYANIWGVEQRWWWRDDPDVIERRAKRLSINPLSTPEQMEVSPIYSAGVTD